MKPSKVPFPLNPRQGKGGFALPLDPKGLIQAVLDVANLPQLLQDPDLVYERLDRYAYVGKVARLQESGKRAAAILACDLVGFEDPKTGKRIEGLIEKLDYCIQHGLDGARRKYSEHVDAALREKQVVLIAAPRFLDNQVRATLQVYGYGAEAMYAAALALLLDISLRIDKNRTYGEALRRCALPNCKMFFLSYTGPAGGRPAEYHDPQCKVEHNKIMRAMKE